MKLAAALDEIDRLRARVERDRPRNEHAEQNRMLHPNDVEHARWIINGYLAGTDVGVQWSTIDNADGDLLREAFKQLLAIVERDRPIIDAARALVSDSGRRTFDDQWQAFAGLCRAVAALAASTPDEVNDDGPNP
jgi:hypothetical protein